MRAVWIVLKKELVDALRDRRTLLTVLISSVFMGPLALLAISQLIASLEARAEQREVVVANLAAAPTLQNYFERQTYTVREAPADYEARLRKSTLSDPVVVVPKDFESALVRGEVPTVEIVSDSANQRSEAGAGRIERLLGGFSRERALLSPGPCAASRRRCSSRWRSRRATSPARRRGRPASPASCPTS